MNTYLNKTVYLSNNLNSLKVNISRLGNAKELGTFLGHLPRELRHFQKFVTPSSTFIKSKSEYLREAKLRFNTQIEKVFKRHKDKETAVIGLKLFFEFDVTVLNTVWESTGLCAKSKLN